MKFSNQFLPHVIVLALIIVAALICFVPCVKPYAKKSSFATYEGFEEQEAGANPIKATEEADAEKKEREEKKGNVESDGLSASEGFDGLFGNTGAKSGGVPTEQFGGLLGNAVSGSMFGGNTFSGNAHVSKEGFGGFLGNAFGGSSASAKNKESFSGIVSAPVGNYAEVLDQFSQVKSFGVDGVNGCSSSGLSNSKGYLCLTPALISALKTRGGNAGGSM